jgi:hypothetical protein
MPSVKKVTEILLANNPSDHQSRNVAGYLALISELAREKRTIRLRVLALSYVMKPRVGWASSES